MSRLPSLGPRGEGWVLGQAALLAGFAASLRAGPAWTGGGRAVTTVVGAVAVAAGIGVVVSGARRLGRSLTPLPRPSDEARLVDDGVYGVVRHPVYAGVTAAVAGLAFVAASIPALLVAAATGLFYAAKASREEAWLTERFPGYEAYRQRTARFIPGVW